MDHPQPCIEPHTNIQRDGQTMVDVLLGRAHDTPGKVAFSYLEDGRSESGQFSYEQLSLRARAIAARLQALQIRGERALLVFPEGLSFVEAFYGTLFAGVIAVPVPAPDLTRQKRTMPRLLTVARDAGVKVILTTAGLAEECSRLHDHLPELNAFDWIVSEQIENDFAEHWKPIEPQQLAYLQYTSGSTREPKGVMISHHNIITHAAQLKAHYGMNEDDVEVSWMPHFHDYALLEAIILPVFCGATSYLMSPRAFIKRPLRWLEAISRYKAMHSQGPNFAYDYCVRRIKPEQRKNLDLSNWRNASIGAEPIRVETLKRFHEAFRSCGLRKETLAPSYGLAEATLLVSTSWKARNVRHACFDGAQLEEGMAVEVPQETPRSRRVVNCGQVLEGVEVAIIDPITHERKGAGRVGEVWTRGAGVAMGYWNRPLETAETFGAQVAGSNNPSEGPFMRTGDLGVMLEGSLYITGRLKDLLIIGGRNHYPQDLEFTAEQAHEDLRPNGSVAFCLEIQDDTCVGIAVEVKRGVEGGRYLEIVTAVMRAISEEHNVPIGAVVLVRSGSVPKTSSGKIQRQRGKMLFLNQQWEPLHQWTQSRWRFAVNKQDVKSPVLLKATQTS